MQFWDSLGIQCLGKLWFYSYHWRKMLLDDFKIAINKTHLGTNNMIVCHASYV